MCKFGVRTDNGIADNRVSFQNTINFAEINGDTIRIRGSSDVGTLVTGDLVWVGDTLELQHNA